MFLSDGNESKRLTRTTSLIADFKPYWRTESDKLFADGWAMAVGSWFRDQLDIFLTDRVINKKPHKIWTQGPCFSFSANHIIYNTPIAHTTTYWRDAVPYIDLAVQVSSATPNTLIENEGKKIFREGFVVFDILKPFKISQHKTPKLLAESSHTLSQNNFVRGLMNGMDTVL